MNRSQISNSGRREVPVKEVSEFSVSADQLRRQRIAEKAYELYQCRGCCPGGDLADWLEAERSVSSEMATQSHGDAKAPRAGGQRAKRKE